MSPTLRSLASFFLLIATVTPNATAAPTPPDPRPTRLCHLARWSASERRSDSSLFTETQGRISEVSSTWPSPPTASTWPRWDTVIFCFFWTRKQESWSGEST